MDKRVLGVLGGLDLPTELLHAWARSSSVIYAADSAADRLVPFGFEPVIVGDLDSIDPESQALGLRIVKDVDPDRTDCDKLLDLVVADGHGGLTLAGIEGDLLDHVLASLSSVAASRLDVRLALRRGVGHVLRAGQQATFHDTFGKRVSLIPLSRSTGVRMSGVLWELDDAVLEPGGALSVSNEGTGETTAAVRTGTAVLFIEYSKEEMPIW